MNPPSHPKSPKTSNGWNIVSALGLCLTGTGVAMIATSRRPSRISAGLFGTGTLLTILGSPQLLSPGGGIAVACAGAVLIFGPFYLQDRRNGQVQGIFMKSMEKVALNPNVKYDDGGPAGHAVSKPHYQVLTSSMEALWKQSRERIRVDIAGYELSPTGEKIPVLSYAYASRNFPWEHFELERIDDQIQ